MIGIVGAESTGKSMLADDLAAALGAQTTSEALRDFVAAHGRAPRRDEQAGVLTEQLNREAAALERARAAGAGWVVCDPCALMTAVYSIAYYGDESLLPGTIAHQEAYDVVLWCGTDLPWEPEPGQRDGPDRREQVHGLLAEIIERHGLDVVTISGERASRLRQALAAIDRLWPAVAGRRPSAAPRPTVSRRP